MNNVPRGLRLVKMMDSTRQAPYLLAFSEAHSDCEDWFMSFGGPDENALLLMKLLRGTGTLIDVGANIGTISVPVAACGSQVIAIEMIPANCLKLWTAVAFNGLRSIRVVQVAASDYDGMITFQGEEAWGNVYAGENGTPAVCLRLDTILSCLDPIGQPLVLKIDVEGHEAAVLRGAMATLEQFRPIILFEAIEIEGTIGNARLSKEILESLGYRLFLKRGNILSPKTSRDVQEGHVTDFLGCPSERLETLSGIGAEIRPLSVEEQLAWVKEMVMFQERNYQRHAAQVFLRWGREDFDMCKRGQDILLQLLNLEHLGDLRSDLQLLAAEGIPSAAFAG